VGRVLLTYDALTEGEAFAPVEFVVSQAMVEEYEALTGSAWTPAAFAGIWARLGYQTGHTLPDGGVMAGMTIENVRAYAPGTTLTLRARVAAKGPRRKVVVVTEAYDGGDVVGRVTIDARWGA
jgi:hypothetical protein